MGSSDTVGFSVVSGPLGYGDSGGAPSIPPPGSSGGTSGGPGITAVDREGQPNILSSRMPGFEVSDASGAGLGWSITVSGDARHGLSPVLKEYCPLAECGSDPGPGYVAGGITLPHNSLILDSSGARFDPRRGTTGLPPTYRCDHACFVDVSPKSPSKVVTAGVGAGMGTFKARGFSDSSVRLVAPRMAPPLPPKETYRVDLSWSLNSGP